MTLLLKTMEQTDPLSWAAYVGLGVIALWLAAQWVALLRAWPGMNRRASLLARLVALDANDRVRLAEEAALPALFAGPARALMSKTNGERLHELEHRVRQRVARSASFAIRAAPGLGVAGTMSGAWVFLSEFDTTAATGQPSMAGLTDATATTWLGLCLMVLTLLTKSGMDRLFDRLFEVAAMRLPLATGTDRSSIRALVEQPAVDASAVPVTCQPQTSPMPYEHFPF